MARQLGSCYPASLDTVLSYFPKFKHKTYLKAIQSLYASPPNEIDGRVTAFVKVEKIKDPNKDPRMIQYRSTRFNILLGRFTRPMEKLLYRLTDPLGERIIAKGMNQRQRAIVLMRKWSAIPDPVAISMDLTRWDLHCNKELLKVMHKFYTTLTPDPELRELLKYQLVNKGTTGAGIKYQSSGGVMSGDMTTALGNCALLVIVVMDLFQKLTLQEPRLKWALMDDGDDFVLIVNSSYVKFVQTAIKEHFTAIGHVIKMEEPVRQFHQIEFCQMKPLQHHGIVEFVPNPHKVLATAFIVVGTRDPDEYLRVVWQGRAILHQGQPVLGPIFLNLTKKYPPKRSVKTGIEAMMAIDGRDQIKWSQVENDSRQTYTEMWGWSIEEQLSIEQFYSNVSLPIEISDGPNDGIPWSPGNQPLGHSCE